MSSTPSNCARGSAGEGRGPAHEREELVHRAARQRAQRPRAAGRARRAGSAGTRVSSTAPFCIARVMAARGQQVAAVLREDDAARDRVRLVARRGRCAACRWPPRAASRSGPRGRRRPCRCPSSSDDVATIAGRRPALSASSISTRCSRASEPWCARASSSPASSLRAAASRSARRRLFTKMMRRAVGADQLEQARVDGGPDRAAAAASRPTPSRPSSRPGPGLARAAPCPRPAPRPSGRSALRAPASTIATGRGFQLPRPVARRPR